jgi:hypothetical protein
MGLFPRAPALADAGVPEVMHSIFVSPPEDPPLARFFARSEGIVTNRRPRFPGDGGGRIRASGPSRCAPGVRVGRLRRASGPRGPLLSPLARHAGEGRGRADTPDQRAHLPRGRFPERPPVAGTGFLDAAAHMRCSRMNGRTDAACQRDPRRATRRADRNPCLTGVSTARATWPLTAAQPGRRPQGGPSACNAHRVPRGLGADKVGSYDRHPALSAAASVARVGNCSSGNE